MYYNINRVRDLLWCNEVDGIKILDNHSRFNVTLKMRGEHQWKIFT